jgi:ketose-bisphosphate aldolase
MNIDLSSIFNHARENGYALGAFNVANLETLKAIVNAAQKLSSPVIIEASSGEIGHIGAGQLRALVDVYRRELKIPILLNLDHAIVEAKIKEAIQEGFDLIHVDASTLPGEENVALTKKVVEWSHAQNLLCEGELDHIGGSSDDHRNQDVKEVAQQNMFTNPDNAIEFIEATGIDTFAAFFGNAHGLYSSAKELDFSVLERLRAKTKVFLSMHGSSGIRDEDVQQAIKVGGIVKINMNSELRVAYRESLDKSLQEVKSVKLYEFMEPVIAAVQSVVEGRIRVMGSEGKSAELAKFLQ